MSPPPYVAAVTAPDASVPPPPLEAFIASQEGRERSCLSRAGAATLLRTSINGDSPRASRNGDAIRPSEDEEAKPAPKLPHDIEQLEAVEAADSPLQRPEAINGGAARAWPSDVRVIRWQHECNDSGAPITTRAEATRAASPSTQIRAAVSRGSSKGGLFAPQGSRASAWSPRLRASIAGDEAGEAVDGDGAASGRNLAIAPQSLARSLTGTQSVFQYTHDGK